MKRILIWGIGLIIIIIVALLIGNNTENKGQDTSDTIKLGYIIYPPLLTKDPTTGKLSGISHDIVEAVAKKMNVKTEWTEEVGWGTALEGLNTNRYDVLGTQMWPNEAREKVAMFSDAPMNSVINAYVKTGDTRFSKDLSILDSDKYKITTVDGDIAVFIANEDYPKANLITLPQLSSYAEIFLNILQNKADITFSEPSAVEDFLASHPNTLEKVNTKPLRMFGNSFAMNKKSTTLMKNWNQAVQELIDSGEIKNILEKNKVENFYSIN